MKTLNKRKLGLILAAAAVAPASGLAQTVRVAASVPASPVSPVAGSRVLTAPGALGGFLSAPSLSVSPAIALAAPAPALGAAPVAAILPAPAALAARPQAAAARTPRGRGQDIRAAAPTQAAHALTEKLREEAAAKDGSRSESLDSFYDGSSPMVKPTVDWWQVGGRRYESTAELVRAHKSLGRSREAIYHYRHAEKKVSPAEYGFNVAATGASAGLIGATSGALLWMFSGLMTMGMPDLFLITGFFGGALGFIGLLIGAMEGGKPSVNAVTGKLRLIGKKLYFFARGSDDKTVAVVNLDAYARARTPRSPRTPASQSPLLGAVKGLGLGLLVAVSMMIPFLHILTIPLMGPGVAWDIGRRLSLRSHAVGGLLGGALGLLVPLSYFAALTLGGAQNIALMAAWAGVLGLIGAVLGALLNNPLRRADAWAKKRVPKGQWWNREP